MKSDEETSETPAKSSPTSSNATTSQLDLRADAGTQLAATKKAIDSPPDGNEPLSESINSDNPWLVEPNDLEKEKSQDEPHQEEVEEKREEEETRMPISPVEEFEAKVEETNDSILQEEEPSVEQKVDSFEEFVTLVESGEIPKKKETPVEQIQNSEDVGSPQTASAVKHNEDLGVEQQTNSFEEFVTQVESGEVPKKEREHKKESLQDFVLVQKEEDMCSPQSAHAVIVDVHVTSVIRDPADSLSAPIEDSSDSSSGRASSVDRYASESPSLEPNSMSQDASGQVKRSTVDPIHTSVSNVSEQAVLKSNADSYGGGNVDTYPSTEAVSPKGIEEDTASELEGGRLWFAAMRQANESAQPAPSTPNRRRLPETLMERTRSRADVDAYVTPRTPISPKDPYSKLLLCRYCFCPVRFV